MARKGPGRTKDSASSWFRKVFSERPDWLEGKSNEEVRSRWIDEHPSHKDMPKNIQGAMANVKSLMRRKQRDEGPANSRLSPSVAAPAEAEDDRSKALEALEVSIDDCLIYACNLDRD